MMLAPFYLLSVFPHGETYEKSRATEGRKSLEIEGNEIRFLSREVHLEIHIEKFSFFGMVVGLSANYLPKK